MWPFSKRKPNVDFKICDTYLDHGFKIKILIDGKDVLERYVSLLDIAAHNRKIDELKVSYYRKLTGLNRVIEASNQKKSTKTQSSIWHVLGCMPTTDRSTVERAFRRMAMVYHPDHGGTASAFQTLTEAKEKALAKCI